MRNVARALRWSCSEPSAPTLGQLKHGPRGQRLGNGCGAGQSESIAPEQKPPAIVAMPASTPGAAGPCHAGKTPIVRADQVVKWNRGGGGKNRLSQCFEPA